MDFSEFIVYVDESGDPSISGINPQFPAFCLSFCVFRKVDYFTQVVPAIQEMKFRFWGHDAVVLHDHEIRKSEGYFGLLRTDAALRDAFLTELGLLMSTAPYSIIATCIHKEKLVSKYPQPFNPYDIALKFCLERLLTFMHAQGVQGSEIHVVFEARGKNEDRQLAEKFRQVVNGTDIWGYAKRDFSAFTFTSVFAKKAVNSAGLQIADLTARPIALHMLRPERPNRAFDTINARISRLKHFP